MNFKMLLEDTIDMMKSSDYKQRFKAEYYQVLIRYEKLKSMLIKWDENRLDFTPTCSRLTYDTQIIAMENYISVLEQRALDEGIKLEKI